MKEQKTKNNKAEIDKQIQALTSKIQQNPYAQQQGQKYYLRSEQFQLLYDYESAITDLSKSLYVYPSCEGYVKRGKLYASTEMFYLAFMDFEEANLLYKQQKQDKFKQQKEVTNQKAKPEELEVRNTKKMQKNMDPQTEDFLQKSTVIVRLPQLKQIAKKHEKSKQFMPSQFNEQFNNLMQKMIQQRVNAELKTMKQENRNYEKLLELVKKQDERIKELEKGMNNKTMDYESIFYREMQQSTLSNANKQKCIIYFCTVISEMEKYYLSAKVLSEFEEKVSFEDYEQKAKSKLAEKDKKARFSYFQKIFKWFEKHEDKMERIGQVIKQIPYIGAAFKMIKPSLKVFGWFQEIKTENQCQNILSARPSVTSFNKMSSKVAYQMSKYFKVNITTYSKITNNSQLYKKNCWEKMAKMYRKFKRNQMGTRIFSNVQPQQKMYAEEMANTHATILMAGVAYGIFKLPNELELETDSWQKQIFEKVAEIESSLWTTPLQQDQIVQSEEKEQSQKQRKGCSIF